MTITRTSGADRLQSAKVDGATHEVSWTIEFGDPVTGVDTDGASSQFAINLAGESTYRDSASTDVMVTGSGATYTATVALPQSSYPTTAELHLAASSTLSAIRQVNNIHNNGVSPQVAGDILTDASNDYQINTGSLTVASINSQTAADRTVVYTITFDARVSNVTADNFALTQSGGTTPLTGSPTFSVASPTGANSRTGQSGTFAYEWIVTTTSISAGESPRLSLLTSGIIAEGDTTTITQPTGDDAYRDHSLSATAPTITASDAIRTNNADATTRGGEVSWDITFNQVVIDVDTTHFSVSHGGSVTSAVSDTGTNESRVWRITADLPTTGQSTGVSVALTLNPTMEIRGAGIGGISYSAIDALEFTQTYSLRTLSITSVSFNAYADMTATTELTGPVLLGNSVGTAVQSPVLLRYVVTYNLPPSAPTTDTYSLSCSVPSCVLSSTASLSGNIHILDVTNIPDTTGTISLTNGLSSIADMSSLSHRQFYFRPRVTLDDVETISDSTDAILRVHFSEAVDGFSESDIIISDGVSTDISPTSFTKLSRAGQGVVYEIRVPLASFISGADVSFEIDDIAPFMTASNSPSRIFNSSARPLPFVHSYSRSLDDFLNIATAPILESVELIDTPMQSSGDISWKVTFDQSVTNILGSHFRLSTTPSSSIIDSIVPTITKSDNDVFTLTASIPSVGIDSPTEVSLSLNSSSVAIRGSSGITSSENMTMRTLPLSLLDSHVLSPISGDEYSILSDARFISLSLTNLNHTTGEQTFTTTFTRSVSGLKSGHFSVATTPNPDSLSTRITSITPLSGSSTSFVITTQTGGTTISRGGSSVELSLNNLSNISPSRGSVVTLGGVQTATGYFEDRHSPSITSITRASVPFHTQGNDVLWNLSFSEAVQGISPAHFKITDERGIEIPDSSLVISPLSSITSDYVITASLPSWGHNDGTRVNLSFSSSAIDILDRSGNGVSVGATTEDRVLTTELNSYMLDTRLPQMVDIVGTLRSSSSRYIDWKVTFNEPVRGVTSSSFILSSGSEYVSPPVKRGSWYPRQ